MTETIFQQFVNVDDIHGILNHYCIRFNQKGGKFNPFVFSLPLVIVAC